MTEPVTYSSQIIPTLITMAIFYGYTLAGWLIVRVIRKRLQEIR